MIKAAFFDIDGTLVSFKTHQVPDSAREAVKKLRANGVKVFIASGRHINSINNLSDIEFDGYVVINGTFAFMCVPKSEECPTGREVIYRHPIPQEDVHSWLDFLEEEPHSTIFVYEEALSINYVNDDMQQIFDLLDFPSPIIEDLRPLRDKTVYQIISTFRDDDEARIMTHLPHCKTTRWHPLFTDIIEQNASKAPGIQAVLDHFGWSRDEVMAFGDGGNDLEMLDLVGVSVVMGNAEDSVKSHASYVTDTVDDDGVQKALLHYGLI